MSRAELQKKINALVEIRHEELIKELAELEQLNKIYRQSLTENNNVIERLMFVISEYNNKTPSD